MMSMFTLQYIEHDVPHENDRAACVRGFQRGQSALSHRTGTPHRRIRAGGGGVSIQLNNPFALSQSKGRSYLQEVRGFDKLSPNGRGGTA